MTKTVTTMIHYRGELAGFAGATRASLVEAYAHLPPEDPDRRFVLAMAAYASAIANGNVPGPYTDKDAERFARAFLISGPLDGPDEEIAGRYGIPVDQIAVARREIGL